MKTIKFITIATLGLLLQSSILFAQDTKNQMFWIHVDEVKPSMIAEYEAVGKDFVEACKKHDLKDADFTVASVSDGSYLSISPIENMADLDKNTLAPLSAKMGEENFNDIFKRFNKCYDTHYDHVVHLISDLSYMPNGLTTNTVGQDYRKWHYLYVTPENAQNLRAKIKDIKALYEKKNAKEYVRIYRSGFGVKDGYYLAVISAKDEASYAKTNDETDALFGEEGKKLFAEMMKYVDRYEVKTGRMRPDLGYVAKK